MKKIFSIENFKKLWKIHIWYWINNLIKLRKNFKVEFQGQAKLIYFQIEIYILFQNEKVFSINSDTCV